MLVFVLPIKAAFIHSGVQTGHTNSQFYEAQLWSLYGDPLLVLRWAGSAGQLPQLPPCEPEKRGAHRAET